MMQSPSSFELPNLPRNRTGWPWTEDSAKSPNKTPDGVTWPRITIVTPNYNQAPFLEATLCSVLGQSYPNLEYIVVDGSSTDGSADIIRKYERWLAYWISEPDNGQYDAINKGFRHATGEVMAWLNSDDLYFPWTLHTVGEIFAQIPQVRWLTTASQGRVDVLGRVIGIETTRGHARTRFFRGENLSGRGAFTHWIQQESTFWRRDLWEQVGARLDDSLQYAGDFDLWARFWRSADLVSTVTPLGAFRIRPGQKSSDLSKYIAEAEQVLAACRDQGLRNPLLIRLARAILKLTGRGGERWGSRLAHVDFHEQRWQYWYSHTV